ncbi:hypothetical protein C815_00186 [Firmicutes bacterium M10-2]|nr:hypothetical protein C815_00186 [Firmicutes bacterium M10-2]
MESSNRQNTKKTSIEQSEIILESSLEFLSLMTYYRAAIREVETKFQILADESTLLNDRNPINDIQTRLKSPKSIFDKLESKELEVSIENIEQEIFDVAGIRIVCPFIDDIDRLANAFLEQDDIVLIKKKDYIRNPKRNGYRSLHLIVEVPIFLMHEKKMMKVEVQLRTIAMEFWASLEHQMRYKKALSKELVDALSLQLLQCAQISDALDNQMQNIRNTIDRETKKEVSK